MAFKRFLYCADSHGDLIHDESRKKLLKFAEDFKPHYRIHGGDLWDFRSMRKGASEEDRHVSLLADFNLGVDFLHDLKPNVFIHGNHDHRLWFIRDRGTGFMRDAAAKLCSEIDAECKKLGIRQLTYHRQSGVLRIGKLKMLHGFFCGVYAARQHASLYGSCLFGHIHTIDVACVPHLDGPRIARSVGCLCSLNMEWDSTRPSGLRQAHGWAYGVVDSVTGEHKVFQAEQLGGRWFVPTEFAELPP